jgi:hypothetical protein
MLGTDSAACWCGPGLGAVVQNPNDLGDLFKEMHEHCHQGNIQSPA